MRGSDKNPQNIIQGVTTAKLWEWRKKTIFDHQFKRLIDPIHDIMKVASENFQVKQNDNKEIKQQGQNHQCVLETSSRELDQTEHQWSSRRKSQ